MRGPNGTAGLAGPTGPKGDPGEKGKDGPSDLSKCSYHSRKSSPGSTPTDVLLPDSHSTLTVCSLKTIQLESWSIQMKENLKREKLEDK